MLDWLIDVATIMVIVACLLTFLPASLRQSVTESFTTLARLAWRGIVWLAYMSATGAPPPEDAPPAAHRLARGYRVRGRVRARSAHSNAPNADPRQSDAETDRVRRSRSAFGVRDDSLPHVVSIHPELPQSADELQRLARAIVIHAQAPRGAKQRGIREAFGISPGGGPEWERASALFDLALPRSTPPGSGRDEGAARDESADAVLHMERAP